MNMTRNVLVAAVLAVCSQGSHAASTTFTFDSGITQYSTSIQAGMNQELANAGLSSVTVTSTAGALRTNSYNGDGHVNGNTLSTSASDYFIINNGPNANQFTFQFANFLITSVSFDWEIFPNASCQYSTSTTSCYHNGTSDGNWPDFTFRANGTLIDHWFATAPAAGSAHLDPQGIGTTGTYNLTSLSGGGATSLTFVDWPAEVGIDNLVITGCLARTSTNSYTHVTTTVPSGDCGGGPGGGGSVPEPTTLALLGLGLGVFGWSTRRRAGVRELRA